MQVEAILTAAIIVRQDGILVCPQIMIPLIAVESEVEFITNSINTLAEELFRKANKRIDYKIGIMLEVPRVCLITEKIAKNQNISFVSFGTNDLTQMVYGFSRDDSSQFLSVYKDKDILPCDPFTHIVGIIKYFHIFN
jgi:pyruvate,orthophosphate dikinase